MSKRYFPVLGFLLIACIAGAQSFGEFVINPTGAGSFPTGMTVFNGKLYFSADNGTFGYEPWVTDGNTGQLLADIFPGAGHSFPQNFTVDSNLLFFQADDFTDGAELWVLSADSSAPNMVKDIYPGQNPSLPQNLFVFDHKLFFQADDGTHGAELWVSDGTNAGTQLLADINQTGGGSAGSFPSGFTVYNGKLYFKADDGVHGYELWATDGTSNGTLLVKDIWQGHYGSNPTSLAVFNDMLFFAATDSAHGTELWTSDGTDNGTQMVKDINPGYQSSDPQSLTVYNNILMFQADDGVHGPELWSTYGNAGGTQLVANIYPGAGGSYPQGFTLYQGKLFFQADDSLHGSELWRTDGTNSGTILFNDINTGENSSNPASFIIYHGNLYFIAAPDSVSGAEMFITDGSAGSTQAIIPGGSPLTNPLFATNGFTPFNNGLAFNAYYDNAYGEQLWFYTDVAAAINEPVQTHAFGLYPNPCRDYYTLSGFKPGETYNISLTDLAGRILQNQQIQASGNTMQFLTPTISAGIYLLEIKNGREISTLQLVEDAR